VKKFLVSTVVAAVAVVGTATAVWANNSNGPGYSDQEYLNGLMFNIGPVADRLALPSLRPADLSREEYETLATGYVDTFLSEDAAELAPALRGLRSGNPIEVEASFESISASLVEHHSTHLPDGAWPSSENTGPQGSGWVWWKGAAVVYYSAVGVVGVAALALSAWVLVSPPTPDSGSVTNSGSARVAKLASELARF
jgi:hypothetical protein